MKKITIFLLCGFMILVCFMARQSFAADSAPAQESGLGAKIREKTIEIGKPYNSDNVGMDPGQKNVLDVYRLLIGRIAAFLSIIFFVQIIIGGVQWMNAGGNEEAVAGAKKRIVNGIIGVAIVLSAYIITYFVLATLSKTTGVQTGFEV